MIDDPRTRGLHADDRPLSPAEPSHDPGGAWVIFDVADERAIDDGPFAFGPGPHGA
jgi:hypothetical protein